MFDCECCWYCRQNCTHYGFLGECGSGSPTIHDRQLFNSVRSAMLSQNACMRCLLHFPAAYPCFCFAALYGCCCESGSYSSYKTAQLDQSHRFSQCVCFNYVLGFTLTHDPNYIYPMLQSRGNPIINISNVNNNEVKTGDVNVRTGDVSNNASSANTAAQPSAGDALKLKIKEARVNALIAEGRFSEAELVATGVATATATEVK